MTTCPISGPTSDRAGDGGSEKHDRFGESHTIIGIGRFWLLTQSE
jgi:hypothetical protein